MSVRPFFRFKNVIKNQYFHIKNDSKLLQNKYRLLNQVQFRTISLRHSKLFTKKNSDLRISYANALPSLCIPLPSRDEQCMFTLQPTASNIGDLLTSISQEDHGIDRITIFNADGVRLAKSTLLQNLMMDDFTLEINDIQYTVICDKSESIPTQMTDDVNDLKQMVARLHSALSCDQLASDRQFELKQRLEQLHCDIEPYEKLRREVEIIANRKTVALQWFCLGMMSLQFGLLARLTWWEYSWDIMEPVTYFVTYGTAIALYAYFVVTKQEPNFKEMSERRFQLYLHQHASKSSLDIVIYNRLRQEISDAEDYLDKLTNCTKQTM